MTPYAIKILTVGQMATNCYVVWDRVTLDAMVIDPGDDAEFISDTLTKLKVFPRFIFSTHGHFDHVLAAFALESMYNIPFYMHEGDEFLLKSMTKSATYYLRLSSVDPPPKNRLSVSDGQSFQLGKSKFTVMYTPGHTPGSICLYDPQHKVLFTGDTVFAQGAVGRTDRTYGDKSALTESLSRIFELPHDVAILPGHGGATTVGAEQKHHVV